MICDTYCSEGSEACGSICNLALINLDRVKQAVINQQCQKYQRQGRDVNDTGQESGQAATQSELQGAISQGQAAENQQGKQSRVIHGTVTETGIMLRMSDGAKQDFAMSVSVKAAQVGQ